MDECLGVRTGLDKAMIKNVPEYLLSSGGFASEGNCGVKN